MQFSIESREFCISESLFGLDCHVQALFPWHMHLSANNFFLVADDVERFPLTQLLWAVAIVGIQCRIEEVAHVINDRTRLTQLCKCASTCAIKGGRERAGLNEL